MKRFKLAVLSVLALAFARPAGFCTANTQAEDIAALQANFATLQAAHDDQQAKLAAQEEELKRLRLAASAPPPPIAELPDALRQLCLGAGVDPQDVLWRIRAGLSKEQAVEAAVNQLNAAHEPKTPVQQALQAASATAANIAATTTKEVTK